MEKNKLKKKREGITAKGEKGKATCVGLSGLEHFVYDGCLVNFFFLLWDDLEHCLASG